VSDFYCGYNGYAGTHQRCWVHLLRDLHALEEAPVRDAEVLGWVNDVRALSDDSQTWLQAHAQPTGEEREQQYVALTARTHNLGLQVARTKEHACQARCKRLLRHEDGAVPVCAGGGLERGHQPGGAQYSPAGGDPQDQRRLAQP
jgi:hypothetical protein